MAATSRRRSSQGLHSSGSSTQLARRGSSGRPGGARGRFDPSFMMSSNAPSGDSHSRDRSPHETQSSATSAESGLGPRRKSVEDARANEKAARRGKSTDRLPRSGASSTNLSAKRSKSYTSLGMTFEDGGGKRRKASSKRDKDIPDPNEGEDGWTSASADNTSSDNSADISPSSSPADDGLVLGIKKRPPALQRTATNTTLPDPRKESFSQPPDTPKASAQQLPSQADEPPPSPTIAKTAAAAAAPADLSLAVTESTHRDTGKPAHLTREDTSRTLVGSETNPTSSSKASASFSQAQPDSTVSDLDRSLSSLRLDTSTISSAATPSAATASTGDVGLSAEAVPQARHQRAPSNASNRTLRSSMPISSSPVSIRSRSSVFSSRLMLLPRESQAAAPPMLDTHNALAGRLGARHEDRGDLLAPLPGPSNYGHGRSASALPSSTSAPAGLHEQQNRSHSARHKSSMGSMTGSRASLSSPSASIGSLSKTGSRAQRASMLELGDDSHHAGVSAATTADRHRSTSTQSLTAADAAKLAAKLRLARDSMDDPMSSGYAPQQRGYNPRLERYKKPVISTFAKDVDTEAPQPIEVADSSVYSKLFSQAHDSKDDSDRGRRMIRYVMGYGISGPPIEKSTLSDALLGPSLDMDDFESSWAPALANAAGLGPRPGHNAMRGIETEYGLVAPDATTAAGGPNSTPLHLIHGLTTTSPDPFPLDPTDVPGLQDGTDVFESHPVGRGLGQQPPIQFVDPGLIRAIAITTHAISAHRMHVVTRRYADPMRDGLERVARSSGRISDVPRAPPNSLPNSPQVTARWGRKTAPNSPMGYRTDARGETGGRPSMQRHNTSDQTQRAQSGTLGSLSSAITSTQSSSNLAGQLYNLVDAAEHPVRSLKRVWSGGLTRGGLAALTRTDEEA
ncbi:hypothetical protein BCV70DRAFT_164294 [Testicularia cyperi]|uniref:Uncharacterized protein n=1 Tax=Testicularia cyperi TaxID=1882483 RepID=A0A317XLZ8_9BASI|nr:hypothetical protein BCV70DRAFT_164294 [Testicularia cyperi]